MCLRLRLRLAYASARSNLDLCYPRTELLNPTEHIEKVQMKLCKLRRLILIFPVRNRPKDTFSHDLVPPYHPNFDPAVHLKNT